MLEQVVLPAALCSQLWGWVPGCWDTALQSSVGRICTWTKKLREDDSRSCNSEYLAHTNVLCPAGWWSGSSWESCIFRWDWVGSLFCALGSGVLHVAYAWYGCCCWNTVTSAGARVGERFDVNVSTDRKPWIWVLWWVMSAFAFAAVLVQNSTVPSEGRLVCLTASN